jgi:hypothetical protein
VFSKKRKNRVPNKSDEAKNAQGQFLFFGQGIRMRFAFFYRGFFRKEEAKVGLTFRLSAMSNVKIRNRLQLCLHLTSRS